MCHICPAFGFTGQRWGAIVTTEVQSSGDVVSTAADGAVRARVSAAGRLEELTIDQSVLRTGMISVADAVIQAVQAAQDELSRQVSDSLKRAGIGAVPADLSAAVGAAEAGAARLDAMLATLGEASAALGRQQR